MMKGKFNVCRRLMAIIMLLVLVGGLIPTGEFAPLCVKAQEEQYMVTVDVNDEAGGKIQIETRPAQTLDSAYFDEGTEITVKAIPNEGYRLAFWGGTRPLGEPGSCEFKTTVNSAGNYMANFVPTTAEVSVSMEDIEIEKKNVGYSISYINPSNFSATHQTYAGIKLKNNGACNLGIQDFTLSGKNADCFHVFRGFSLGNGITEADQDNYYNLGVGKTLTHWYVEPVSGLEVGTYEATLTLVEQCQGGLTTPVSANVKFVVTDDAVIKTEDDGNGTVTGAGNYEKGTNVTLTATPDEHYVFDSWWCDGAEVSTDNPYTFKAETSATYEARFKQVDFLLTATATEGGKVQIEDRASTASTDFIYSSGSTTINIKAIPDEGYRLAYWSRIDFYGESTKPVGAAGACDFTTTLDEDVEYVAHFVSTSTPASATLEDIEIDKQSVGYTVTGPYMIGTIAAGTNHYTYKNIELKNTGDCSLAVQDITLSGKDANCFNVFRGSTNFYSPELIVESDIKNYVIDSNSTLSGWYIEPKVGLGVGTYEATITLVEQCQNGLKEQVSAKVSFSVTDNYMIETDVSPASCGTVAGAGEYEYGKMVTLTATPADTYAFDHWEVNGNAVSTDNPYSFSASEIKKVTAVFIKNQYKVTISADPKEGGEVNTTAFEGASGNLTKGTEVTVTATPKDGYIFVAWIDNGTKIGNQKSVTIKANVDHELVASFEKLTEAELPEADSLVYNGKEQKAFIDTQAYTVTNASAKNVGKYTATFTLTENSVWKDGTTDPKTLDWEITPAKITVTAVAQERNYIAGDKSVTVHPLINGVCGEDKVELDLTGMKAEMEDDAAGNDKTVTVSGIKLKGEEVNNYSLVGQPEGVKVNILDEGVLPKAILVSAPEGKELVYNIFAQELVTAGQVVGGTIYYALGDGGDIAPESDAYTDVIPTAENAGSYTVWYKVEGDATHEGIAPVPITGITIAKADDVFVVPKEQITVPYSCRKVSDIDTLPIEWEWSAEDVDKDLPVNEAFSLTAIYNGEDKDNYNNTAVIITVIRQECEHTETELRNRKDPTDTEQGYTGDLCCIECGKIIEQGKTVKALGGDKETPTEEDKIPDEPGKNNEDKSAKDKVSPVTQTPATQSPADTTSHNPVADTPVTPVVKNENTTFVADDDKAEVVVTSKVGETPTVEYKAPADTSTKNVVIPETVTSEGIEYAVTSIAANAFKNNKKLTKVNIPASVKYIGKNAFCGCKNLKNVNIKTTKLTKKTVGANAFKNIHKKAVVKVPKSKLKAYKKLLKKVGVKGKKQKIK